MHLELAIVFINLVPRLLLKLSIFFSSMSTKPGAYRDRLLKACIYSVRVFVPYVSLKNLATFMRISPRGM